LQNTPTSSTTDTLSSGSDFVRAALEKRGYEADVIRVLQASRAPPTQAQYKKPLRQWVGFCEAKRWDPYHSSEEQVLAFLASLLSQGATYGTLNTARSAVSLVNTTDLSTSRPIRRYLKGVFRLRPPTPRYEHTWEVGTVLRNLETWWPLEDLLLQKLSTRLTLLLALCTAQKVQTLNAISVDYIYETDTGLVIEIPALVKQSRPGATQPLLQLPTYPQKQLCAAQTLRFYLQKTQPLRGHTAELFLSTRPPHGPASRDSIRR